MDMSSIIRAFTDIHEDILGFIWVSIDLLWIHDPGLLVSKLLARIHKTSKALHNVLRKNNSKLLVGIWKMIYLKPHQPDLHTVKTTPCFR